GRVNVEGRLDLEDAEPRYDVAGSVSAFRLDRLVDGLPEASVDAAFRLAGQGTDLGSATADARLDIERARVAGMPVYRGLARVRFADGLGHVGRGRQGRGAGGG